MTIIDPNPSALNRLKFAIDCGDRITRSGKLTWLSVGVGTVQGVGLGAGEARSSCAGATVAVAMINDATRPTPRMVIIDKSTYRQSVRRSRFAVAKFDKCGAPLEGMPPQHVQEPWVGNCFPRAAPVLHDHPMDKARPGLTLCDRSSQHFSEAENGGSLKFRS
jgi:hypothetical protein